MRWSREDRFAEAYKALSRVSRIQAVMTMSWDVLATLTPVDYSAFRHVLGTSSGFQSAQFRELEFRLGIKDPKFLEYQEGGDEGQARLRAALAEPSLWDEANAALARAGFAVGDSDTIRASWLAVYRDADTLFRSLPAGRETGRYRRRAGGWRHKHVLTVERIIGGKSGTGGSAGVAYLAVDPDQARLPGTVVASNRAVSFKPCSRAALAPRPAGCTWPRTVIICGPTPASTARSNAGTTPPASPTANGTGSWARCGPKPRPRSPPSSASSDPSAIVFAANTHDFILRLAAACPRAEPRGCAC